MKIYISENKDIFYEGQILEQYDLHGSFLGIVKINKFIRHKKYLAVNLKSLEYKSKNWTLDVDVLGKFYRKEGE